MLLGRLLKLFNTQALGKQSLEGSSLFGKREFALGLKGLTHNFDAGGYGNVALPSWCLM